MTLTGHWNRIDRRIFELWPQEILEMEKSKWQERWRIYRRQVEKHLTSGGRIHSRQDWTFEFIVRQSLRSIEQKIDNLDFLDGKLANNIPVE